MELLIKNGSIADGTGNPLVKNDLVIRDGKIVSGPALNPDREIDATGQIVAPGFIDIHTHFDPQLCWDGFATPSIEHGVTTVVIGNCSLSLAPVRPGTSDKLVSMFQVIEDIKKPTFDEAVPFTWESFPEYLQYIENGLSINVGALIGHSAVRYYVMGKASQEREATTAEVDKMCSIVADAMAAGALGVSSSYVDSDEHQRPVPSRYAGIDEKIALAKAMASSGRGIWQVVPYFIDPQEMDKNIQELGDISIAANIPCSLQPILGQPDGSLPKAVKTLAEQHQRGARVYGQTMPRTFDMNMRLSETSMLLFGYPKWREIMNLSLEERRSEFLNPSNREELVQQMVPRSSSSGFGIANMVIGNVISEENVKYCGRLVSEIAETESKSIAEVILDLSNADNLDTEFQLKGVVNANQDAVAELIESPYCHFGASDAGAHITQFCGSGDTTYMLEHFVRKTGQIPVERAIHRMTGEVAKDWGLTDRGILAEGKPADVVIFDPDKVKLAGDEFVDDFPGEARRYVRHATGYSTVIVNGQIVRENDSYTDTRSGKIV